MIICGSWCCIIALENENDIDTGTHITKCDDCPYSIEISESEFKEWSKSDEDY